MKVFEPIWSNAPKWAVYYAVDQDGSAYWYEYEPYAAGSGWDWSGLGKFEKVNPPVPRWMDTLRKRFD